jgi:ABC-type multidrug transport system fused ATPase/permease subunit
VTNPDFTQALRLSQESARKVGAGGVINLISNDGAKLENSYEILTVFIGPLQLCSLTWIVWTHFGMSSICGLVAILLLGMGQSYMGKIGSRFRAKVASASSRRVKLVTQIVTTIRTIKMYAWEAPFAKLVGNARR